MVRSSSAVQMVELVTSIQSFENSFCRHINLALRPWDAADERFRWTAAPLLEGYSDPKDDGFFNGDDYPSGWRPRDGVQRGSVMDTDYSTRAIP